MSSKSKNTQLLVAGLVAAATVSLVLYYASTSKPKSKDVDSKKSSSRSIDTTPKKSNRSDVVEEKEMHAKIEELDKKGKALFKAKQVGLSSRFKDMNSL